MARLDYNQKQFREQNVIFLSNIPPDDIFEELKEAFKNNDCKKVLGIYPDSNNIILSKSKLVKLYAEVIYSLLLSTFVALDHLQLNIST